MAPLGNLHFHPAGEAYCEDFGAAPLARQGLFIHEMAHVWQFQKGIFLPLRRLLSNRYSYELRPGRPLEDYGIEQQAEIIRHAFLLRNGARIAGAEKSSYDALVAFPGAGGETDHAA